MAEESPAHAILRTMVDVAKDQPDLGIEMLCLDFADLLADSELKAVSPELYGELVLLGAALWRHSRDFRDAGTGQTRQ